jgi:hypothetical protein
VGFSNTGVTDEQDVTMLGNETGGGELEELGARELRVERPVEIGELLNLSDGRLPEPTLEQAIGTSRKLVLDEQFQELHIIEGRAARLLKATWKSLDKAREA